MPETYVVVLCGSLKDAAACNIVQTNSRLEFVILFKIFLKLLSKVCFNYFALITLLLAVLGNGFSAVCMALCVWLVCVSVCDVGGF